MNTKRYVCSNDQTHQFDENTADGLCPICEFGDGLIMDTTMIQNNSDQPTNHSQAENADRPTATMNQAHNDDVAQTVHGIGLCIIIGDASGSMNDPAFKANKTPKKIHVANSIANAIHELRTMSDPEKALVYVIGFDGNVKPLFLKSVKEIVEIFPEPEQLKQYILNEFEDMGGCTDINQVLTYAQHVIDTAINTGDLSQWGGPSKVTFATDAILPKNGETQIITEKALVVIQTDAGDTENPKIINPFAGEKIDRLIGAFFGPSTDPGCTKLKQVLSKCPKHDFDQFFLIDNPKRIATLRHLFRMASGTNGFCPLCLADAKKAA